MQAISAQAEEMKIDHILQQIEEHKQVPALQQAAH